MDHSYAEIFGGPKKSIITYQNYSFMGPEHGYVAQFLIGTGYTLYFDAEFRLFFDDFSSFSVGVPREIRKGVMPHLGKK